jgi:hypothetical protein
MAGKPRTHPIHSYWRYGITGPSKVLENAIVNIEQCGETDYSGMMESYSIQEVMKARCPDLEDMLAEVMAMEKETGKIMNLQSFIIFRQASISALRYGSD